MRPEALRDDGKVPQTATIKVLKAKAEEEEERDGRRRGKPEEAVLPAGAFPAELAEWDGEKFKAVNEEQTLAIVDGLAGADYVVSKVEQKDRQEKAPPPFTTSTLQQQASLRLHSAPAHHDDRPEALPGRRAAAARARWRSLRTCVPTARASPRKR